MTLYTGKGDGGTTKLFNGPQGHRLSKTAGIFDALGTLDELNSLVGWCKVEARTSGVTIGRRHIEDILHEIQECVFTAQAELAGADKKIPRRMITGAERTITQIETCIPPISSFVVAGGTELSARLDIARTVCRRAERLMIAVHEVGERKVNNSTRAYLNRLSSLLYALGRIANTAEGVAEIRPTYKG